MSHVSCHYITADRGGGTEHDEDGHQLFLAESKPHGERKKENAEASKLHDRSGGRRACLPLGFGQVEGSAHCHEPVSYTHLDVYKRQALLCGLACVSMQRASSAPLRLAVCDQDETQLSRQLVQRLSEQEGVSLVDACEMCIRDRNKRDGGLYERGKGNL